MENVELPDELESEKEQKAFKVGFRQAVGSISEREELAYKLGSIRGQGEKLVRQAEEIKRRLNGGSTE